MLTFADVDWVAALDAALRTLDISGPQLRVRYRFTVGDDSAGASSGYHLVLGDGARAEPASDAVAAVTITQPMSVAAGIAAGELSAQRCLLEGIIHVEGAVTELVVWREGLQAIDTAMAELRSETVYPSAEPAER